MIPPFTISGYLPPFVGADPAQPLASSPYLTTMSAIVSRFGTTAERVTILNGLLAYRELIRSRGIIRGFQWIAGSFVEDCEATRMRPPGDVDVVTFAHRSTPDPDEWGQVINNNLTVFDSQEAKATYKVEAYYIDLEKPPHLIVHDAAYWSGLFSHQRSTGLWKGMLIVDLSCDDAAAIALLEP